MPTTDAPPSPSHRAAPPRAPRRLAEIRLADGADAIVRVLALLRRRGCVVVAVEFRLADRHRPGHLAVVYEPPARTRHTVAAWLANLVDVLDVRDGPA